jgi:hypothetical protein
MIRDGLVDDTEWRITHIKSYSHDRIHSLGSVEEYLVDIVNNHGEVVAENVYDADAIHICEMHNEAIKNDDQN